MKVYVDNRKKGNKYEKAISVYSEDGKLMYSDVAIIREESDKKFERSLLALDWAIKKFRKKCQNNELSEAENVLLFINSKTIYDWFEKDSAPVQYIDLFSSILEELSLMVNETEIIYSEGTKALYRSTENKGKTFSELYG